MPRNPKTKSPDFIGWAQPLAAPVKLRDGKTLKTLMDAAEYLLALPVDRQTRPVAVKLAEDLRRAHVSGDRDDITDATRQIKTVIEQEGPRG